MNLHQTYMHRCLQLASLGMGHVPPNPMVGAVLVHGNRIIGEGYHQQYGQAHAEVNCINSVATHHQHLVQQSTLYVSLEPCNHFGKTPPCVDLIIQHKIPAVVVGCTDHYNLVNGMGIKRLAAAGIVVTTGILEKECQALNKRFFTFIQQKRPYIILKWAETKDGFIGRDHSNATVEVCDANGADSERTAGQLTKKRLQISNELSNRLVHKWRTEEAAIMVGTQTTYVDNPQLTTRLWKGSHPLRVLLDMRLRLAQHLHVFNKAVNTVVFNAKKNQASHHLQFVKIDEEKNILPQICDWLYQQNYQSILVEGGSKLLQSFLDNNLYDEIRIIKNEGLSIGKGVAAPTIFDAALHHQFLLLQDVISMYQRPILSSL